MGSSDRVAPHVFQNTYLATDGCIVYGNPQRTEIMMVTDPLKDSLLAIQEETFVRYDLDRADAERSRGDILQLVTFVQAGFCGIQSRHFRRP